MVSSLTLASESEHHAGDTAQAIDDITQSMERLTFDMNQVVVAIEDISTTTGDIAQKMEEINAHTSETRKLRLTPDGHTKGLSIQVQALSHSAGKFVIS